MNRKFLLDATPARARLMCLMAEASSLQVDDAIEELGQTDRITQSSFTQVGIDDVIDQQAVQFIHDTNFRCGIPSESDLESFDRSRKIVTASLKIAEQETIATFSDNAARLPLTVKPLRNQLSDMTTYRNLPLVVDLSSSAELDLAAKIFPKIVAIGRISKQSSFSFGSDSCTSTRMGHLLYPASQRSLDAQGGWRPAISDKALLMMGLFPYLLKPQEEKPTHNFLRALRSKGTRETIKY